jgi:dTDP-4-dehydrorhamnose reductase
MQANVQPDILINAAAYPWVYGPESEPDGALAVDPGGAGHIAAAWLDIGMPLIQISADYGFDGTVSRLCGEEERIAPLRMYGHSQ